MSSRECPHSRHPHSMLGIARTPGASVRTPGGSGRGWRRDRAGRRGERGRRLGWPRGYEGLEPRRAGPSAAGHAAARAVASESHVARGASDWPEARPEGVAVLASRGRPRRPQRGPRLRVAPPSGPGPRAPWGPAPRGPSPTRETEGGGDWDRGGGRGGDEGRLSLLVG